jgi:hypothetical protein
MTCIHCLTEVRSAFKGGLFCSRVCETDFDSVESQQRRDDDAGRTGMFANLGTGCLMKLDLGLSEDGDEDDCSGVTA